MTKINKILSALVLSLTTYLAGTTSASALSLNIFWNGNGDINQSDIYSLTGSFTGTDVDNDGFIRGNKALNINEFTDFVINFRKDPSTPLATYDFNTITDDPSFNFNYQISSSTILQDGAFTAPTGFSIGNSVDGYSLDSNTGTGSNLSFNDNIVNGLDSANGGTLEATPVPFEFESATGLLILGTWLSRKKVMAKIKSWRSKG